MSNQELFKQVEDLLQQNLTPEERTFLVLANEVLQREKDPPRTTAPAKAKIVA